MPSTASGGRTVSIAASRLVRLLWGGGALVAAALFVQTWDRAHRPGGVDLTSYLAAARIVLHGGDPYLSNGVTAPYLYPPFFASALVPIAFLPEDAVLVIWFLLSIVALIWLVRRVVLEACPELASRVLTPFLAALFVVTYPVIQSNLRNGQVNVFVLTGAIAALVVWERAPMSGAFALAAATAVKLVPAAALPYFVRRREWRFCVLLLLWTLALTAIPLLVMGRAAIASMQHYASAFLVDSFARDSHVDPLDFSLGGVLLQLVPSAPHAVVRLVGAVVPLTAVFLVDAALRPSLRSSVRIFVVYLAVIPMVAPKSEIHHLVFAVPAAAVLWARRWFKSGGSRPASALLVLAGAAFLAGVAVRAYADVLMLASLASLVSASLVDLRHTARE